MKTVDAAWADYLSRTPCPLSWETAMYTDSNRFVDRLLQQQQRHQKLEGLFRQFMRRTKEQIEATVLQEYCAIENDRYLEIRLLGRTLRFVFFTSVLNKESSVLHGIIDVYLIKSMPAEQWIILDQLTFNGDGMIQRGGMHLKDGEGNDLKDDHGEPIHIESRSDNALLILAVEVLEKGLRFQGNYL